MSLPRPEPTCIFQRSNFNQAQALIPPPACRLKPSGPTAGRRQQPCPQSNHPRNALAAKQETQVLLAVALAALAAAAADVQGAAKFQRISARSESNPRKSPASGSTVSR